MANFGERIVRGLGGFTVVAFVVIALTPVSNAIGRRLAVRSDEIQQSDAIVVLGAGLLPQGVLGDESERRVITGIELFKRGMAPLLVLSGPARPDAPAPTEGSIRAKLAETMGILPAAILLEETANTTHEESIHISRALQARNATRILLVTDSLHMRRAKLVFERAGLQVQPAVSADYPAFLASPGDRLWLSIQIVRESGALTYYRLAGYI